MVPRRVLVALVACGVIAFLPQPASPRPLDEPWVRIEAREFTLYSNGSERTARALASELETMRRAVSASLLPQNAVAPTRIFLFRDSSSFDAYRDAVFGIGSDKDGIFFSRPAGRYIVLDGGSRAYDRLARHELSHWLVDGAMGSVPTWVNEGFAGLLESFREERGRGRAGHLSRGELHQLRRTRIPLAAVLSLSVRSEEFLSGPRSRLIYAQTRLMMHYLLLGAPEMGKRLPAYLALVREGEEPIEAFEKGFQTTVEQFERELVAYAHRRIYGSLFFEMPNERGPEPEANPIAGYQILAELSGLLSESGSKNIEAAESLAVASLELEETPRGHMVLGLAHQRRGNLEEALQSYEKAMSLGSADPLLMARTAHVALRLAIAGREEVRPDRLARATELFRLGIERDPSNPDGWSALGIALSRRDDSRAEARAAFEKALSIDPENRAANYWLQRLTEE